MKHLFLIIALTVLTLPAGAQHLWDTTSNDKYFYNLMDSNRLHTVTGHYIDTSNSLWIITSTASYDTVFMADTLHPDNIVGVRHDGFLQEFNCKMLIHTYYHRLPRGNKLVLWIRDRTWNDKYLVIGAPAVVLKNISFIYSYQDRKSDGGALHMMSIESCINNNDNLKLADKYMWSDCLPSSKPSKAKYLVWWAAAPRRITLMWFYYRDNAKSFCENNKNKWSWWDGSALQSNAAFHLETTKGYPTVPKWMDDPTWINDQQAFGDKP